MIALYAATGLVPIITALVVVLWKTSGHRDGNGTWLAKGVAMGLAAGALGGAALGLALLFAVIVLRRVMER
jgi:hypothetical protein